MIFLREATDFQNFQVISEGAGDGKSLFIEGVFAQAEKKNRNGRIYPKKIMESSVGKYITEYVSKNRAMGELSHPENRPTVKPELASHLITVLEMRDNDVYGKAKILNTPQGKIVQGLLEGGVSLGVSTRGLGSITERAGTTYVCDDYCIMAVDVVGDPSAPDAWVNAVNEGAEWLITDDGRIVEQARKEIKKQKLNEATMLKMFQDFLGKI